MMRQMTSLPIKRWTYLSQSVTGEAASHLDQRTMKEKLVPEKTAVQVFHHLQPRKEPLVPKTNVTLPGHQSLLRGSLVCSQSLHWHDHAEGAGAISCRNERYFVVATEVDRSRRSLAKTPSVNYAGIGWLQVGFEAA